MFLISGIAHLTFDVFVSNAIMTAVFFFFHYKIESKLSQFLTKNETIYNLSNNQMNICESLRNADIAKTSCKIKYVVLTKIRNIASVLPCHNVFFAKKIFEFTFIIFIYSCRLFHLIQET